MLQGEVKEILANQLDGEDYDERSFIKDLQTGGCVSGLVGELVHYSDTIPFYERNKKEINEMLTEMMDSCGCKSPKDLFHDNWDETDPLAMDTPNQNLLAWFAFEETAFRLYPEYY